MKKKGLILIGLILGILLTLTLLWIAPVQNLLADFPNSSANQAPTTANPATDSTPTPFSPSLLQSDEQPPANVPDNVQAPQALPTPVPGETQLFFVPTDNDATATVLYLYNTDTVAHTVPLRGFSYNGVLVYSLNINVAATSFIRLSSDSIVAAPPPSWATPAPIITNFTDFTYYASLSLPKGVKVEGYVLFNPGTGTVDPRKDQGAIPLRFSTDPATLFLPSVQDTP